MAKKARRVNPRARKAAPQTNAATQAPDTFEHHLTRAINQSASVRTRNTSDSRSNVLQACAMTLESMQATLQVIAQAAVLAPNFTDTAEVN